MKHLTKHRLVLVAVFTGAVLIAPSSIKWAIYEQGNAAPRLRSMIGTEVTLPQQTYRGMGKNVVTGPHTGTLSYVGYRCNDAWGWFDLEVHLEGQSSSVQTGLSPGDARAVVVVNRP